MFIKNIEKEILIKPLQIVVGVVERKQTMPILSNILIEKNARIVKFSATDLEIQICTKIDTEDVSDGAVTLPGKKLLDILRILPDQSSISIDIKDSRAQIKSEKSRFNLQTLPAQDFPVLNNQTLFSRKIVLPQNVLKSLFNSIQYAMAQQDVRYYLNGVLLGVDGFQLKAVATDGHRLAFNSTNIDSEFEKQEIIIPRKAVMELSKLLSDEQDEIVLEFSDQQMKASFSGIQLSTKLIDGKFPDYDRVIPSYTNHLNINRLLIQQALQRAAILSNEKFRGVRFVLTEKNLSVVSNNSEQEEAQIEIETEYHGDALDIGFNVNYLLDGINSITSEQVIFSFGSPNSSILITSPDNNEFRYVVMPMRI